VLSISVGVRSFIVTFDADVGFEVSCEEVPCRFGAVVADKVFQGGWVHWQILVVKVRKDAFRNSGYWTSGCVRTDVVADGIVFDGRERAG
jgi:hypothetical protein